MSRHGRSNEVPSENRSQMIVIPPGYITLDVENADFPVTVKIGTKEYLLVKSQFGKLMLNRKDQ